MIIHNELSYLVCSDIQVTIYKKKMNIQDSYIENKYYCFREFYRKFMNKTNNNNNNKFLSYRAPNRIRLFENTNVLKPQQPF